MRSQWADEQFIAPDNRSPFHSLRRRQNRCFDVLSALIAIAVVLFAIGPIVWTLLTSFKTESEIVSSTIHLPAGVALDGQLREHLAPLRLPHACSRTAPL